MSFLPVGNSRVTSLLQQQLSSNNIQSRQRDVTRLSNQLSTGLRVTRPSDDPSAAYMATQLVSAINQNSRYSKNIQYGSSFLQQSQSSLQTMNSTLDDAYALGTGSVSSTTSSEERASNASSVDTMIRGLLSAANQQYSGNYVFGGQKLSSAPFQYDASGGILFTGDNKSLNSINDQNSVFAYNSKPNDGIGTDSVAGHGTDLNPGLTLATRLSELNQGAGVGKGSISINNVTIDLSTADTLQDVKNTIEGSFGAGVVNVNIDPANASRLEITGTGTPFTINEVAGGTTARDLGILSTTPTPTPLTGGDLNPVLLPTTLISSLNNGGGIDQTAGAGLHIVNGPYSADVSTVGVTTVQDLLNRVNAAGVRVRAEINDAGNGLNVVNTLAGFGYQITETTATHTAARDLGLYTTTLNTELSEFNDGAGVPTADGVADFQITLSNGMTSTIDIEGAKTVADVNNIIRNTFSAAPFSLGAAQLPVIASNELGGIKITDNSGGAGAFTIASVNGSGTAGYLGIEGSVAAGNPISTNNDVHLAHVHGIFDSLYRLKNALLANDATLISRSSGLVAADRKRVSGNTGDLGSSLSFLQKTTDRLADQSAQFEADKANVVGADYAETITKLLSQQTALQASLQTTGRLLQTSLLDFI